MREGLPGILDVSLDVLADDGLLVLAGDVVPLDAVAVEVVEDGQARFRVAAILDLLPVVGLDPGRVESSKTNQLFNSRFIFYIL